MKCIENLSNTERNRKITYVLKLDKKLDFVAEKDTKGIKDYTIKLNRLLDGNEVIKMEYDDWIATVR